MPNVYDVAQQFRNALLSRDRAAAARLISAYGLAYSRLLAVFNQVSADITAARDRGEQITEPWLLKQARYRELLRQTGDELLRLAQFSEGLITTGQQIEIERATRDAQQLMGVAADEAGVQASFAQLPKTALEKIVGSFSDGSPLSKLFRNLPNEGLQQIQIALIEGVATGQGPRAVARKMRDAFGGNLDRALRVARTEQVRAYREATRENYQRNADVIQGWQWLSARQPGRTCPVCWAMDGQIFPLDTPMGSHVNCRCTQLPVIDAAPLQETGEQIFRRLRDDQIKDLLGRAKFDAYKAGEIDLRDLVAYRRDARWGEQRTERSLKDALAGKGKQAWGKMPGEVGPKPEPKPEPVPAPLPVPTPAQPEPVRPARVPALGSFESIAEAEAWASAKYKNIEFDFEGFDLKALNPVLIQFDRLAGDYPGVTERMKYLGTYKKRQQDDTGFARGHYAHAYTDSGWGIGLNPLHFGNADKFQKNLDRDVFLNWHPEGTNSPEAVFTHEFGHLVDGYLRSRGMEAFSPVVRASGMGLVRDAVIKWQKDNKATKAVSRYALTNDKEGWAEAFAAIYHAPKKKWSPFVQKLDKLLSGLASLPRYKEGEWNWFDARGGKPTETALSTLREALNKIGVVEF